MNTPLHPEQLRKLSKLKSELPPEPPMTDLACIKVECTECHEVTKGEDLQSGAMRMHLPTGDCVAWPGKFHATQVAAIPGMGLICECCQEKKDEREEA